ncbi:YidC/Oxa1 family membrane protein insertase [Agathobacter rectalis]|uniref:Membrane protein insertase YidC n=1 Tax=Agathobacter rectalis TaxID=39491 RepID=A0A414ZI60_9FIRM|nr:YidC/Oxa1 family membrane protein insertase [Agathobacter rectalis]RGT07771.1 membrane protein insertase YidC [Agathobacter rectalis]RGT15697.1 membrane protein insertase YidC [Agathobacter rectalis]RGT72910.1 membrane protein insertase YidC [Agathobacter rectalis]RGT77619.1 membrane protein insertase YidC [Agathobacter rectalis]RHE30598.1 membrane protein insertase YidC [Agathobacter rectalis]
MSDILLTAYPGSILGPIAKLLGMLMDWIYSGISNITGGRVESVVLSIVIITIIIYMCLLPLTIKQQKFSKLSQKMQPEMQAIQAKYKNKKDQASMMAMQEETQLLYQKYGISPMGSCVQMLIQMPILFALYRVFYNIPAYLSGVKGSFTGLVDSIQQTSGYQDTLVSLMEKYNVVTSSGLNASNVASKLADASGDTLSNYIIDILYKLPSKGWDALLDGKFFDGIQSVVEKTHDALLHFNYFLGLNISDTPWYIIKSNFTDKPDKWLLFVILALLIPVLSYLTQMINIKLMPQATNGNDQMASQMKMMNLMMPLMSLFFCFTVPVGLGIYWICSALVRGIQQFFVNRHIENLDLEAVMAKNEEKAKNKRKKMGLSEDYIKKAAQIKTKSIDSKANVSASADTEEKLAKAAEYKANAKAGSLASKANMVKEFNERNSRK